MKGSSGGGRGGGGGDGVGQVRETQDLTGEEKENK